MTTMLGKHIRGVVLVVGLMAMSVSCPAYAAMNDAFEEWRVVSDHDLGTMRGGFVACGGLEISLGIVKAVIVDGVLQTTSTLNISGLGVQNAITPIQISNLQSQSATFVQNMGNRILIQNGANQKTIQNMTIIDATVHGISMLRDINLMSRIDQQLRNVLH